MIINSFSIILYIYIYIYFNKRLKIKNYTPCEKRKDKKVMFNE